MMLQSAGELLGEEEMVARRDHTVESTPSGNAVVGVDLVVAPGVVREDHIGPVLADDATHLAAKIHAHLEFAVLVPEEDELFDADRFARRTLLALPRVSHLLRRHFRTVRSSSTRSYRSTMRSPTRRQVKCSARSRAPWARCMRRRASVRTSAIASA